MSPPRRHGGPGTTRWRAAIRPGRPHALLEGSSDVVRGVRDRAEQLLRPAVVGRPSRAVGVIGVAEVELPLRENLDVAWCEVNVLAQAPSARGRARTLGSGVGARPEERPDASRR